MLKDFLPLESIAELWECANWASNNTLSNAELRRTYNRWGGLQLRALQCSVGVHYPTTVVTATVNKMLDWLGKDWHWHSDQSFIRRVTPGSGGNVTWHRDYEAASTYRLGSFCTTFWFPLLVGDNLPSLELILGSHHFMRGIPHSQPYRKNEWVASVPGRRWVVRPKLGDVVLFDQHILHRTEVTNVDYPYRSSCEFRFSCG